MDKLTQLFIRACKSKNPRKRLSSVYRRFYFTSAEDDTIHLVNILADICDKYTPFTAIDLLSEVSPSSLRYRLGGESYDFDSAALSALSSRIRMAVRDKFDGLTAPALFRKAD